MNPVTENRIYAAFAGLGLKSSLADGFRLKTKGQQTVAVYFSGNEAGNAVEMGLSPVALAPLLAIDENVLRCWIADQAATTGRLRAQRGNRGKYPGVAFGNQRELDGFLDAFVHLRARGGISAPFEPTDKVRIEKAAQDAGFDISASVSREWLVFRSSAFPHTVGVVKRSGQVYCVGLSDAVVGRQMAFELGMNPAQGCDSWAMCLDGIADYQTLHRVLARIAAMCRVVAGVGLKDFKEKRHKLPDSTEAVRLVVQRLGQDIFRSSLLDYWGGRCAVTGLNVPDLLRASHIKRWSECDTDEERLDVFNGLLLAPHWDALFDGGWITFLDSGVIQVSKALDSKQRVVLGINGSETIPGISECHVRYLAWHREHWFRKN